MSNVEKEKVTEPTKQPEPTKKTGEVIGIAPSHANRGNRNALVHGVYASELVLSFESAEDFERLHGDLKQEFKPEGRQEEEVVLAIAKTYWLKHRLMPGHRMPFLRKALVSEPKKSGLKSRAKN
jgi:hypothetical protein